MKAVVLVDPLSKFTEEAIRACEDKFREFSDLELVYVTDHNHENMEDPSIYNLKMEKEGPEGWIKPSPEYLKEIADAELLFSSFCGVTEEMIEAGPKLKLIYVMRSGTENCNVEAAKKRGITVCTTPSRLAEPVADLTVALMIMEIRGILRANRAIMEGKWQQSDTYQDTTNAAVCNLRFGLYGYGGIGRAIAKRLTQGFGAEVVAYDEYCTKESIEADGVKPVSLEELIRTSDVVSIHLRLVESTKNVFGEKEFAMMKPTAIFVNTARAGLVDQQALLNALQNKTIRGACMDVFWEEPIPTDSPFLKMDNVIITPHRAGMTSDIVRNTVNIMYAELKRYMAGETLLFDVR